MNFIKDRLKEMDLTQSDLGEYLNLFPNHISRLISGSRQIQAKEILPLANFLFIDPLSLLEYISDKRKDLEYLPFPKKYTKINPIIGAIYSFEKDLSDKKDKSSLFTISKIDENSLTLIFADGHSDFMSPKEFISEPPTLIKQCKLLSMAIKYMECL